MSRSPARALALAALITAALAPARALASNEDAGASTGASAADTDASASASPDPTASPDASAGPEPAPSPGAVVNESPGATAQSQPPAPPPENAAAPDAVDYHTPRWEPAGFPVIGGNSDIGVLFGVAGTLSRFQNNLRPYAWNMDLAVDASIRNGPQGAEIAQQNYRWQWDIVGLFGGRVRMNPAAYFQRTIDQGYWGIGNASSAVIPAHVDGDAGRYYQVILNEARAWNTTRIALGGPVSVQVSTIGRYMVPEVYAGSQLALDAHSTNADGSPVARGTKPLFSTELSGMVIYDSRDDELMPSRGLNHRLWLKYVQGIPTDQGVAYGAVGFSLAQYVHVGGPFVFASRLLVDAEFGDVPFYDLFRGDTPFPADMPGGGGGVRGVPSGRYLGKLKVALNLEMRALLFGFHIFGQSFRVGADAFFDTGRVWTDYTFNNPRDGAFPGLKYGAGGGLYLRWGSAAIFRAEFAYSPDAAALNPGFPVGIYVEDGVMF